MQTLLSDYTSLRSSRYAIYSHRSHQNEIDTSCILTNCVYYSTKKRKQSLDTIISNLWKVVIL